MTPYKQYHGSACIAVLLSASLDTASWNTISCILLYIIRSDSLSNTMGIVNSSTKLRAFVLFVYIFTVVAVSYAINTTIWRATALDSKATQESYKLSLYFNSYDEIKHKFSFFPVILQRIWAFPRQHWSKKRITWSSSSDFLNFEYFPHSFDEVLTAS